MKKVLTNLRTLRMSRPVLPGIVTPRRPVSRSVVWPQYAESGVVENSPEEIYLYGEEQIVHIRKSARLARKMLDFACSLAKPGVTTEEIDIATHNEIVRLGAYPSPVNYRGFPKAICTSVNEVICHGIPDSRPLQEGDVLSIDVSLFMNGFHGDNCGTVIVGKPIDEMSQHIVDTTKLALELACKTCRPGSCLSDIGTMIERTAIENGLEVVGTFCGHGTGPILHMEPLVAHYANDDKFELQPGMVFTIEPILVEGSGDIKVWKDGWTAATKDNGWGAQFEHEVLITETGHEILTISE